MGIHSFLLRIVCMCIPGVILSGCLNDSAKVYGPAMAIIPASHINQSIQDAYSFQNEDAFVKLKGELEEISGITPFDSTHLAAIQDEKGKIYILEMETGKIVEEDRFDDDGDYEDVVLIDGIFYVLRSDGDVFETSGWPAKRDDTIKYETLLESKHDTEGLAYDAANNRLLIACKEFPGKDLKGKKAIYAFDLDTKEVDPTPAYLIDLSLIATAQPDNPVNRFVRRLTSPVTDMSGFKPSAIGIHPITQHIFVLSSVRKLLLAMDQQGTVEAIWELPEDNFHQPEGIAFLPTGDLFISNEGRGGKANILRFNYNAKEDTTHD